jgi:EAL domain-containing protein (putative c-di-GMP-specific phosphodiesterase class I)
VAIEALIRWKRPNSGLVLPADFIPEAERTGQIEQIGEWVISEICRCAKQWLADPPLPDIHFNLSPRQLGSQSLITRSINAILGADLDPTRITAEITETALTQSSDGLHALTLLKETGLRIVIDDFGTGYSSLSRLRDLPVAGLKLDRSFLANVPGDADATALFVAMIELGKSLGMDTVAEGVETRNELDFLIRQGCPRAQGYLLGHPTPLAELPALLTRLGDA